LKEDATTFISIFRDPECGLQYVTSVMAMAMGNKGKIVEREGRVMVLV
jgi:hypothetical protein